MSLTNEQYDRIMMRYQERQFRSRRNLESNREKAYDAIPRLREIDEEAASFSLRKARAKLMGTPDFDLGRKLRELSVERRQLLTANGFPPNYLKPAYECPSCKDTGYVDGEKCSCFRRMETELLFAGSNIENLREDETFQHFSLNYYSEDVFRESDGRSERRIAEDALECAKRFVRNFPTSDDNLLIYGPTGVGKTFLSHCIAGELLKGGFGVLYLTAFDLFDHLAERQFAGSKEEKEAHDQIFSCDLLIIDDLGTEMSNTFVASQLFLCINERLLSDKKTIISTNLSLMEFQDIYSERTFSRILSRYTMVPLCGSDIRIRKQLSGGK